MWAMTDSNRRHPRCKRGSATTELTELQALTPTPSDACTAACTSEPENVNTDTSKTGQAEAPSPPADQPAQAAAFAHRSKAEGIDQGDPLDKLAGALLALSPADREKLTVMLTMRRDRDKGTAE